MLPKLETVIALTLALATFVVLATGLAAALPQSSVEPLKVTCAN